MAVTGLLATMPYIALQLVGIQVVLEVMGIGGGDDSTFLAKDLPLFIAFAVLAAYTYASGLRAPALIAFVKDTLIYIVIIVAVFYLPTSSAAGTTSSRRPRSRSTGSTRRTPTPSPTERSPDVPSSRRPRLHWAYASLALGSALALFMYPHSLTGVLRVRRTAR